jgi:hypothetical protein
VSKRSVADVVSALQDRLDTLPAHLAHRRTFISTYLRTTEAVGRAVDAGFFEDGAWVEQWDVVFADLYLVAHDADAAGEPAPRPWRATFDASPRLHPLQHLLLGVNAHINYDLPQSLVAVIPEEDFDDAEVLERRRRDHERIDRVLSSRIAAEDSELRSLGPMALVDRLLTPVNRLASRRFLRESRRKVWHNTFALRDARRADASSYAQRLWELEVLSAARITDLLEPGFVLIRLATSGFGVTLPPPAEPSGRSRNAAPTGK